MGLDGIELCQPVDLGIQLLDFLELQVFHKAWVQVLKLSRRSEFVWQQEVLKLDRQGCFCV